MNWEEELGRTRNRQERDRHVRSRMRRHDKKMQEGGGGTRLRIGRVSVGQFGTPRSIRFTVLLLGILAGILAPSERGTTQERRHSTRSRWHSRGNRARRRLVAAARRGRRQTCHRGNGRGHRGRRMIAVKTLQMGEQS